MLCPLLPRKVTAVIGVPVPISGVPSSHVCCSLTRKHTLFPSLKHSEQHPSLDTAPPSGCHRVSHLPFQALLPERVSASSFLSPVIWLPPQPPGEVLQPGLHGTCCCPDPSVSWLLDLSWSGHSLPLDLPPVLAPLQHLTLLITPSYLKFAFPSGLTGLWP